MDRPRLVSIVIPLFNEQETLPALAQRLREVMPRFAPDQCEVLLISDGSTDRTNEMLACLTAADSRFNAIVLSRNFGHQAAVSTGLAHAQGDVVAIIDGDLQDPPEELPRMIRVMEQEEADVVYAVRRQRKESILKRTAYAGFYRLLRSTASIDIPLDSGDFCVMSQRVVQAMLSLPERRRFVRGLRAWVGFKQVGMPYERHERHAGRTKYSMRKLMALAYDGLFSFSSLPVKIMQALGFVTSAGSLLMAVAYLSWYVLMPSIFPAGWATLVIAIFFLSGVQLMCMGLLGEYVHRTFEETRSRPTTVIAEALGSRWEESCKPIMQGNMPGSTISIGGGEAASATYSRRSAA